MEKRKTRLIRSTLILVFSAICLANILAGIFPKDSERGMYLMNKLSGIRTTTGTWQRWDMFHTIPALYRLGFNIVAKDSEGNGREFGAGLPGFFPIVPREAVRYHYTFVRIFDAEPEFLASYVSAVREELRKVDPELVEFSIEAESEFTRILYHVRKDGEMTMTVPHTFGPYRLDDA